MHAALAADAEFSRGGVDTGWLARFADRQVRSVTAARAGGPPEEPMADIQILDVSIRDGNQSLWGRPG